MKRTLSLRSVPVQAEMRLLFLRLNVPYVCALCRKQRWKVELVECEEIGIGGMKECYIHDRSVQVLIPR